MLYTAALQRTSVEEIICAQDAILDSGLYGRWDRGMPADFSSSRIGIANLTFPYAMRTSFSRLLALFFLQGLRKWSVRKKIVHVTRAMCRNTSG